MAKQTAIERRDRKVEKPDTLPGEIRELDDFQKSFLNALDSQTQTLEGPASFPFCF